jgi:group I intron endonuclease
MRGIYAIVNQTSRKVYIGSTANSFSRRWATHKCHLQGGCHANPHLQAAWNKYGKDAFEFMVCEHVTDMHCLIEREQYWLDEFRLICPVYNYGALAQHPMLGRKHTDEARAKISRALTGRPCSEETRQKRSQSLMGHPVSEKTRRAVGEANRRRVVSEESRCKMRESRLRYLEAIG